MVLGLPKILTTQLLRRLNKTSQNETSARRISITSSDRSEIWKPEEMSKFEPYHFADWAIVIKISYNLQWVTKDVKTCWVEENRTWFFKVFINRKMLGKTIQIIVTVTSAV